MKKLIPFLFVIPLLFGFTGTNVIDTFSRADENPISGDGWIDGINGTANGCKIVSNELTASSAKTGCYWTDNSYTVPQEAFGDLPNGTNHVDNTFIFVHVCIQNEGTASVDSYAGAIKKIPAAADQWLAYRYDNFSRTALGSLVTQEIDDGDQFGVEVKSNGDVDVYHNDAGAGYSLILSRNDTTYSCDGTKIGFESSNTTGNMTDNFGGGDNVSAFTPYSILRFR